MHLVYHVRTQRMLLDAPSLAAACSWPKKRSALPSLFCQYIQELQAHVLTSERPPSPHQMAGSVRWAKLPQNVQHAAQSRKLVQEYQA